jgi:hypothetical protein
MENVRNLIAGIEGVVDTAGHRNLVAGIEGVVDTAGYIYDAAGYILPALGCILPFFDIQQRNKFRIFYCSYSQCYLNLDGIDLHRPDRNFLDTQQRNQIQFFCSYPQCYTLLVNLDGIDLHRLDRNFF